MIRPAAIWLEGLRLLPGFQPFETRDGATSNVMTEAYYRGHWDIMSALGYRDIIVGYTSYIGYDLFPRAVPFFDGDVGANTVWWADGAPSGVEDFDPLEALCDQADKNGQKVWMGVNRAGDSNLTLDLYATYQLFEPGSQITLSGTSGSQTVGADLDSFLPSFVGMELRPRLGAGLATITARPDEMNLTITITETFDNTVYQSGDWAVTLPDPMFGGQTVLQRLDDHMNSNREDAARLHDLYGAHESFAGWYLTPELGGLRTYCEKYATPLLANSGGGNPGLASYGLPVRTAPAITLDVSYDPPRDQVIEAVRATQNAMPAGTQFIIEPQDAIGPGYDFDIFDYTWDPLSVIDQRPAYFAQWRRTVDAVNAELALPVILGGLSELWVMDGTLGYQDPYPNDINNGPRQSMAIMSDYATEISSYAGFGYLADPAESLRPVQAYAGKTDYYDRAVRLLNQLRAYLGFTIGKMSARPAVFLFVDCDPPIRLWSGFGDFTVAPDATDTVGGTYSGMGELVGLPVLSQLLNGVAERVEFGLSGVSQEIVNMATDDAEAIRYAPVHVGIMGLDNRWQALTPPQWFWDGTADSIGSTKAKDEAGNSLLTVSLSVASGMIARSRATVSFFTGIDHRRANPTDAFCDRTTLYSQDTTVRWPT